MCAEPSPGPIDPLSRLTPQRVFPPRAPVFLPVLLPYPICRGTRFAEHRHRPAPTDPARLALLLEVCGYHARRRDVVEMRGAGGYWLPAPPVLSSRPMPLLALLQFVCDRDWPARMMDPNDERLDFVFA